MSFEQINNLIRAKSGNWTNLRAKGDKVAGKIMNVEERDQSYQGKVIPVTSDGPNKGKPRKEWVFTLETEDGSVTKVACKERAQWAITGALNGRLIKPGGHLQIEVVEKEDKKQAEMKAIYTDPVTESPFPMKDNDESPF